VDRHDARRARAGVVGSDQLVAVLVTAARPMPELAVGATSVSASLGALIGQKLIVAMSGTTSVRGDCPMVTRPITL